LSITTVFCSLMVSFGFLAVLGEVAGLGVVR
jgi:hypothetical protein